MNCALAAGIIHRDIKPKNLFLDQNNIIKIGDFGLAKLGDAVTITGTGDIFGTPDYMAPEIFQGNRATWKSDQFALRVTLYEILAGTRPFHAENVEALIYQYVHSTVPDIRKRRKEIGDETMNVILRMMSKSPYERFDSYEDLIDALESIMKRIQ